MMFLNEFIEILFYLGVTIVLEFVHFIPAPNDTNSSSKKK